MRYYTVSNTSSINRVSAPRDIMCAHDVMQPKNWKDDKDAAQCILDRWALAMHLNVLGSDEGFQNPQIIGAMRVSTEVFEDVLVFTTIDEDGYVVTWQVVSV